MEKKLADLVSNRKAFHDYEILDTLEAGLILFGTEIKSLKNHGGTLQDAYIDIRSGTPLLINANIAPYKFGGSSFNHEEKRARKLLLHKKEIEKLARTLHEKNLVAIPLAIYLNKKGYAKVKIGIGRGKKNYDQRMALKEKEHKRSIQRALDS